MDRNTGRNAFLVLCVALLAPWLAHAQTVIRVNAAGDEYTDSAGHVWSADNGYNTGNSAYHDGYEISGTNDPELFRSERWDDDSDPELQYSFSVPNGTYQVKLYFAENFIQSDWNENGGAGLRVFSVLMQGASVFPHLDVIAEAGQQAALVKTATVTVTNGTLNIDFVHEVENPMINAIEIISQDDTESPTTPSSFSATAASSSQVNLSWGASTDNVGVTSYSIERCQGAGCSNFTPIATAAGISYINTGLAASTSYTYRVRAQDAAGNWSAYSATASATTQSGGGSSTAIRVHSGGGPAYTDSSGNTWSADYGWTSDDDYVGWYTSTSISGTNDPELFRYARWDDTPAPELQYSFAVPNGTYQVKLYFAETAFNWTGARIFDVQMEGTTVFSDLDVYAEAGLNQALIKTATVNVSDGELNITFIHGTENPFVDAIEIVGAADTQPPSTPTNLTTSATSSSQINLSWTASTDNVGVTNYLIERCQGSGCSNFAQIATTSGTSYSNTGLSASTSYSYRIRATDAAGNLSGYSSTSNATTSSGGGTQVTDNFNRSDGGLGVNWTNVIFSSAELQIVGDQVQESAWNYGESLYTGASFGGAQFSELQAVSGLSGNDINLAVRTRQYGTTGTIDGYVGKIKGADNTWGISRVDDQTEIALVSGALSYSDGDTFTFEVNGSTLTLKKNGVTLGTATDSTYTDGDAGFGIWNPGGLVVDNWRGGELSSGDTQAPSTPSSLSASAASSSQINLSWTASTDNVGVTNYLIERCQGASCSNFTQIATASGTSYSNTGLSASTSYSYRIRATDAAENLSGYSSSASATTTGSGGDIQAPTAPTSLIATANSGTQITLSWTASTDDVGVTGYLIERCQGAGCSNFAQVTTTTSTSFSDSGLSASTSYSYRVRASDAASNLSDYSSAASATTQPQDTTPPTTPSALTATATSNVRIQLDWAGSTDDVAVTAYLIERCQGAGCTNFVQIASTSNTSSSNTGLASSTTYRYRVRATDAAGNLSGYSGIAVATTPATGVDCD